MSNERETGLDCGVGGVKRLDVHPAGKAGRVQGRGTSSATASTTVSLRIPIEALARVA